jgi:hypothetical protein
MKARPDKELAGSRFFVKDKTVHLRYEMKPGRSTRLLFNIQRWTCSQTWHLCFPGPEQDHRHQTHTIMLPHNSKIESLDGLMSVDWAEEISLRLSKDLLNLFSPQLFERHTRFDKNFRSQIGRESHKPFNPFSLVDHREQNIDLLSTVEPSQIWQLPFKNSVPFNISDESQMVIFWVAMPKSRGRRPYPGQEGYLSQISNSVTEETMNFM